ncbi:hypothetical protein K458DRAFT_357112 [Lentithecium fluviatile CBS 122367]|uniref:C2H2-type domain-containing protein n=1 Tax=Lentithecium fluviatile CBS 122367 TaxID=1168545 RepID=A0A6G1JIM2_9PLEO|nr:hypothetical protein K458DRAFT_357112 [Lentithecium fluviatile CBS 122367]
MSSRDQPTPPFNSPYQQALKSNSLLHSPAYPLPARSDAEASNQPPQGLGLYNYPSNSILFPPSPQPSEAWSHNSHGTSPMIPEPIVDPWTSGAYDHPVSRSPIPWPHYQASHRSSLSSQREMSVFSADGSDYGFVQVKLEGGGSGWNTEEDSSPHGTVAPNRLSNASAYPYHPYTSPSMSSNTITAPNSENRYPEHLPQEGSPTSSNGGRTGAVKTRRRKNKTSAEDAKFSCDICGRGFVRLYNKKSHMQRHNPKRAKDHNCPEHDCDREFERKADLDRHHKSVHQKLKDQVCPHCDKGFSRPDTLRRHVDDGCTSRNQLQGPLLTRTPMQTAPVSQQPYYPSPRPEMYEPAQSLFDHNSRHLGAGGFDPRSPPLFRDNTYASPHGF